MRGWVYFMREQGMATGPVKIGYSADPRQRVYAYNTMSPRPLEIVALVEGGIALENRFHARFTHLRSHHEWFHSAPELEDLIAQVIAGTFDPASLPDSKNPVRAASAVKGWAGRERAA